MYSLYLTGSIDTGFLLSSIGLFLVVLREDSGEKKKGAPEGPLMGCRPRAFCR
jgi:hypothetical protein